MLAMTDPHEAYRVSEMDARICSASPAELVSFCLDQVVLGIGTALSANARNNLAMRSKSLTRALTALTALEMGVDRTAPLAEALMQIYSAARHSLLNSALNFKAESLELIRADFSDIARAVSSNQEIGR